MATTYSYAQLEQLWINAGGAKSLAPVAAAIAEAESGGNPAATNPTDNNGTQTSWGLWQISDGTHNQPVANILDPTVNAQAAVAKYQAAGGWSPWGTYGPDGHGAYLKYLSPGTTPDGNVPAASTTAVTTQDQGGACLIAIPHTSQCIVSKEGVRLVLGGTLMGVGGLLVLVGLVLVAVQSGPGKTAVQATPLGRGASAVTRRAGGQSDELKPVASIKAPAAGKTPQNPAAARMRAGRPRASTAKAAGKVQASNASTGAP